MMFSKIKTGAICFLGFAMTSAYAGSIEIISCEPGSLSYSYSVSEETATIYVNSASAEDIFFGTNQRRQWKRRNGA